MLNEEGFGYWISLNDLANHYDFGTNRSYKWISTGLAASYLDFLPHEPTHKKGPCDTIEHCIELRMENKKTGWNDRFCSDKLHFICEK